MSQRNEIQISEILEVWESWNGWYWFVTEYHGGGLAFGLVRGWEIEWGYFDLNDLRALAQQSKVWLVPKSHWALCPCVRDDAALCSWLDHDFTRGLADMNPASATGENSQKEVNANGRSTNH